MYMREKTTKFRVFIMIAMGLALILILNASLVSINLAGLRYTKGLAGILKAQCYQTNVLIEDMSKADFRYDIKYLYHSIFKQRLVDYANGYYIDLPKNMKLDFSLSGTYIKGANKNMEVFISQEYSPYDDVVGYIDHYMNRFVTAPAYQLANRITQHEDILTNMDGKYVRMTGITRTPAQNSEIKLNSYTYAYIFDAKFSRVFYRIMIKQDRYNKAEIDKVIKSFSVIDRVGKPISRIDTKPVLPNWNEETSKFYQSLTNREDIMWGVYTHKLITENGISPEIFNLESKLNYTFPLCMGYVYLSEQPPIKGLTEAYEKGKITELTVQISTVDNQGLDSSKNPNFEVLDGEKDETIRGFARAIKAFSHPLLLRLNNEMNTDWTSYAGVVTLQDPEIYKQVHARVYKIFQEEGVDNVIWIFNPQYGNYPPASWNNYLTYYPGNKQVQLLGITKYNTGNYYKDVFGEKWESFKTMYDDAENLYKQNFADIPWIITEFSSSSIGGNKANWIKNMFADIGKYKNIKAAVWFNFADSDFREGKKGVVSRPYFLDETPETTEAFKEGLSGKKMEERLPETEEIPKTK